MIPRLFKFLLPILALALFATGARAAALPDPVKDAPIAKSGAAVESVVFAGGCFWGVQAVFQHTKGVKTAISGYSGGEEATAHYDTVSTGTTGHAESVKVTYDPSQITFGQLMKVFFQAAHNPTELNYQGPDHGTQYRSNIFYTSPEQNFLADAYIKQLDAAKVFSAPIVTRLDPLKGFYPAEDYHQDFAKKNPFYPYIVINDAPKVAALKKDLLKLYVE